MSLSRQILSLSFVLAVLSGCSDSGSDSPGEDANRRVVCVDGQLVDAGFQGIIGGTVVSEQSWISKKVLFILDGDFSCTATLVARDLVLTAAHCVDSGQSDKMLAAFSRQIDCDGERSTLRSKVVRVAQVRVHPDYDKDRKINDIALVRLESSAPWDYGTVELTTKSAIELNADRLLVAGYGRTAGEPVPDNDPTILRATTLPILRGQALTKVGRRLWNAVVHADPNTSFTIAEAEQYFTSRAAGEYVFLEHASGRGVCMGDSGGPAFAMKGGRAVQVGVASYVINGGNQGDCLLAAAYSSVVYHRRWLEKTFNEMKTYRSGTAPLFSAP